MKKDHPSKDTPSSEFVRHVMNRLANRQTVNLQMTRHGSAYAIHVLHNGRVVRSHFLLTRPKKDNKAKNKKKSQLKNKKSKKTKKRGESSSDSSDNDWGFEIHRNHRKDSDSDSDPGPGRYIQNGNLAAGHVTAA